MRKHRSGKSSESLHILSIKKDQAKLSASQNNGVEVGQADADLRQSSLFTVCQDDGG